MRISEQGLALIRQSEGFSAETYICPAGKTTIGYGHVVRPNERFPDGIDKEEAENILQQDVTETEQAVSRLATVELSQNQFDALVAFAYNIGVGAFEKSTLLRLLNDGDMAAAAGEFGRWVYAGDKKLDGLVRRRSLETALFNGDPIELE